MISIPIIIEEYAGIDRANEPVTVGIPFPKGLLTDASSLSLIDPEKGPLPLQTQTLADWPDKSLKWVLLDFQTEVEACTKKQLELSLDSQPLSVKVDNGISITESNNHFEIDTKAATFILNSRTFKPFESVIVNGIDCIDSNETNVTLKDESEIHYEPIIENIINETEGNIRTTIKVEGKFKAEEKNGFAKFFSRLHFFVNSSMVKMEFAIHNPRAAKHPGGLWDLGDPGSIYFKDLSVNIALADKESPHESELLLHEDSVPMDYQDLPKKPKQQFQLFHFGESKSLPRKIFNQLNSRIVQPGHDSDSKAYFTGANPINLLIYQDSSGGENWKSKNHVNRNNEVKTSFRGFKIYQGKDIIHEGLRANPIVSMKNEKLKVITGVQYFWQNFPKALEVKGNVITTRLFPEYYNDLFELQGGEQKTHTIFMDFSQEPNGNKGLGWIQKPLIPYSTPEWYSQSGAFDYLIPEGDDPNTQITDLIKTAIQGDNTLFHRREIIDEYGWRNFGEFYADHEAVGHKGAEPLISHYNNQYDCIYSTLIQFVRTGDIRWFFLADQLCGHLKDIDIYHTDEDRPENNKGMFWHTEHYVDAKTSTHRCFSKRHAGDRNLKKYGGGPSLSHIYSTGILYHYYLTGNHSSLDAIKELASNVLGCMDMSNTLTGYILKGIRKTTLFLKTFFGESALVELGKVYGLDGPGRASGNTINTLIDIYMLTKNKKYLKRLDSLIVRCIHPEDNIEKRDLLDVENRWMYTVFLKSLGKYLDMKTELEQFDSMFQYTRQSLLHYASWMLDNEYLYLESPEKLEYPNETWAAQEFRKCNVFLYASKYGEEGKQKAFWEKARYFYKEAARSILNFGSKKLTRPIALIMQNVMIYSWFGQYQNKLVITKIKSEKASLTGNKIKRIINRINNYDFSLRNEFKYIKWRIKSQ